MIQVPTHKAFSSAIDAIVDTVPASDPGGAQWLATLRRRALHDYEGSGIPTRRDEAWRYLDLRFLEGMDFQPPERLADPLETDSWKQRKALLDSQAISLTVVNGVFCHAMSNLEHLPPTAKVMSLGEALSDESTGLKNRLASVALTDDHAFTALNTAIFRDGIFVSLGKNCVVDKPIYILHLKSSSKAPQLVNSRVFFLAEEHSKGQVIEDFAQWEGTEYFENAVTEIQVSAGSNVGYAKIIREAPRAVHIGRIAVRQDADSAFTSASFVIGGRLVRNDLSVALQGPGASCSLLGFNYLQGSRVADDHTVIRHETTNCTSEEHYRTVLEGDSRGVFNGEIFVAPNAQKTNSRQSSRNLVLSKEAVMNTKPELKIYADDVKCAHGATIGQLDEEAIFYLRARGLGESAARSILKRAFAHDAINKMRPAILQEFLVGLLDSKLAEVSG